MKKTLFTNLGGLLLAVAVSWNTVGAQESGNTVDDETCLECHDGYAETLRPTAHRLSSDMSGARVTVACVSCHSGGAVHIEDPDVSNITNPAQLTGKAALEACTKCHPGHTDADNYGFDNHSGLDLNCAACHQVHGKRNRLLRDDSGKFCLACHEPVQAEFTRRSNHPLLQGNLTCLNCHRHTKRSDDAVAYDLDRVCRDCHPDLGGPFPFEHPGVNAYAVEGAGCVECHEPHGSENDHLLKQPGSGVCLQCHIRPPGHEIQHGGIATQRSCQTCHTGLHGSFVSDHFLDPNLPAIINNGLQCYDSGCHDLDR
ncbi:MAG: hypothetical protein D6800_04950 [Candidatus Zixiibacteriota bacterium]|nr:MAG: hypothetical protein D6800_04950 [candidate division Zixibacteria bacterium]